MEVMLFINVGGKSYDVTNAAPDAFPDEAKKALIPAQRLFAQIAIKAALREFEDNMPEEDKHKYEKATRSEKQKMFTKWLDEKSD